MVVEFQLDPGIVRAVLVLNAGGVETFESCEGGPGHAFPEPTVRFHGDKSEGLRALSVALANGLKVFELRRYYAIIDGEPVGPHWEMVFVSGVRRNSKKILIEKIGSSYKVKKDGLIVESFDYFSNAKHRARTELGSRGSLRYLGADLWELCAKADEESH